VTLNVSSSISSIVHLMANFNPFNINEGMIVFKLTMCNVCWSPIVDYLRFVLVERVLVSVECVDSLLAVFQFLPNGELIASTYFRFQPKLKFDTLLNFRMDS